MGEKDYGLDILEFMHCFQNHEQYKQEILDMLAFGRKAEIEALYAHGYGFLAKFITHKIVQRDYI